MNKKKILVTGGLGFIGSNLTHRLLEEGHSVTVFDNLQENLGGNLHNLPSSFLDSHWINRNIADEKAFEGIDPNFDQIYHCSSQTSHIDSMKDPILDMQINVGGAINVALFAAKHEHKPHVIYTGTRAQLGKPRSYPVVETTIGDPTDVYGIHKQTAEDILHLYSLNSGYKLTTLVITNCYGYRHQMKHPKFGVLNWFIRLAMDGETITIYGDGLQKREYLFVEDAVEALLLARNASDPQNRFILSSDHQISVKESAEKVVAIAKSGQIKMVPWPSDRKAIESGDWVTDASKIRKQLNWSPKVSFDEGLERTIRFYQDHRKLYW